MKAKVQGGRLILDEPTSLPDGSEVELVALDGDDLDDDERRRLHAGERLGCTDGSGTINLQSENGPDPLYPPLTAWGFLIFSASVTPERSSTWMPSERPTTTGRFSNN